MINAIGDNVRRELDKLDKTADRIVRETGEYEQAHKRSGK